jgi:serine/threonine protein phosphatase 1
VLNLGHLVCIDTGCGLGGILTAFEPASGRLWQVDERGRPA